VVRLEKELHPQPADELHRAHGEALERAHEQRQDEVFLGQALLFFLQSVRASGDLRFKIKGQVIYSSST
jgi:hypothetical protein